MSRKKDRSAAEILGVYKHMDPKIRQRAKEQNEGNALLPTIGRTKARSGAALVAVYKEGPRQDPAIKRMANELSEGLRGAMAPTAQDLANQEALARVTGQVEPAQAIDVQDSPQTAKGGGHLTEHDLAVQSILQPRKRIFQDALVGTEDCRTFYYNHKERGKWGGDTRLVDVNTDAMDVQAAIQRAHLREVASVMEMRRLADGEDVADRCTSYIKGLAR